MATKKSYTQILDKVLNQVRNSKQPQVVFQVPPFFVGDTLYKPKQCILFLVAELRKQNYNVRFKRPNYLFISKSGGDKYQKPNCGKNTYQKLNKRAPHIKSPVRKAPIIGLNDNQKPEKKKRSRKRSSKLPIPIIDQDIITIINQAMRQQ